MDKNSIEVITAAGLNYEEGKDVEIYESVGCAKCNQSGFKGRLAIHEALYFTKELRQIIVRSGDEVDEEAIRKQAKLDGSFNLRDSGMEKVRLGLTSIPEVIAATSDE